MATITRETYTAVMNERNQASAQLEKALQDGDEFLTAHYGRVLRACEKSYSQAVKANIIFERKERREKIRDIRERNRTRKTGTNN